MKKIILVPVFLITLLFPAVKAQTVTALGSPTAGVGTFSSISSGEVMSIIKDPSSNDVYVGGYFNRAGSATVSCVAKWDGSSWSAVGAGLNARVNALIFFQGTLIAAGEFNMSGSVFTYAVARWDGTSWQPMGSSFGGMMPGQVYALAEYNGELYIGGNFSSNAAGTAMYNIARWNGTDFVPLPGGGLQSMSPAAVTCMMQYGNDLFIGGEGLPTSAVWKYNGTTLSVPGSALLSQGGSGFTIHNGQLYTTAGDGLNPYRPNKWDGSNWTPMSTTGFFAGINDIVSYNGQIYVATNSNASGLIFKYTGSAWTLGIPVGAFGGGQISPDVMDLEIINGELYFGGDFNSAGGMSVWNIARLSTVPGPTASFISSASSTVCAGSCLNFTNTSSGSPSTYKWTFAGATPSTSSVQNPGSICFNTAGTYTVSLEVFDANGGGYAQQVITVNNATLAQPASISGAAVVCSGSGARTYTAATVSGATSYSWNLPSGWSGTSTDNTISITPGASGGMISVAAVNLCASSAARILNVSVAPLPNVMGSVTNALCNGTTGSATLTASGGAGAYTYSWSSGATSSVASLPAGAYTATVTDANSCVGTGSVTITEPAVLVTSTAISNALCNGSAGSGTILASGGSGAYTYSWSGGATTSTASLLAGTYTVKAIDANNCSSTGSVTITQPAALLIGTSVTNALCNGSTGSATISASGGTGAYTYSWSGGAATSVAAGLPAGMHTATVTDANNCGSTGSVTIVQPPALIISTSVANALCNGGTGGATVTASGGTGAYTYSWSSGAASAVAAGLPAGIHTATVTDANNCSSSGSVTITEPPVLMMTLSTTSILCYGGTGTATISAFGGTGAYTYLWSGGATASVAAGLSAGTHTLTITDANNCTYTASTTFNSPAALVTTTAVTNALCNGNAGSATITASGGTGALTYSWSSSATVSTASLLAGIHTVTVTDANNCIATRSVTITEPPVLVTYTSVIHVPCNGGTGSATLIAYGGTGAYTYSWTPGAVTSSIASGLFAGTYTATVTDANNCSSSKIATITQPAALIASVATTSVLCNGGTGSATVTASGGIGYYTYSWIATGITSSVASGLAAGNYSVITTDLNNCTITKTLTINQPPALVSNIASSTILCFSGTTNATLTASGGTGAYTYSWTTTATSSVVTGLPAGIYTATVKDANNCTSVKSITLTQPPPVVSTAGSTPPLCHNSLGSGTIIASGGTGAITYSWSTGATTSVVSLPSGTFMAQALDANNCSSAWVVFIIAPSALNSTVIASPILCNGGSGTSIVTASGGTGAYTYSWSTGATASVTSLQAGVHTVTVTDANNCTGTTGITITQPAALTINTIATQALCNGGTGSATLIVTGGTAGYTQTWSNGASTPTVAGLLAGVHTATVTDVNGCSGTQSVTITQPPALAVSASASTIHCHGDISTVTVSASGGISPYTGAGTFTALAGPVTYTITDSNGCSATASVSVTEPAAITSTQSINLCAGQGVTVGANTYTVSGTYTDALSAANSCDSTITTVLIVAGPIDVSTTNLGNAVSANASGATYQWVDCNNAYSPLAGQTGQLFTATADGSYAVVITENGCADTSACVTIFIAGIPDLKKHAVLSIYPNPGTGIFTLGANEAIRSLEISDALGRKVTELRPGTLSTTFDLGDQPNGIYFITVRTELTQSTARLILNK